MAKAVTVRVDDRVVCERCLVADRPLTRMRGLLGRTELPRGEGILLQPQIAPWAADRDGKVVGVERELKPWRTARHRGAKSVLELAAGAAAGIDAGASLVTA